MLACFESLQVHTEVPDTDWILVAIRLDFGRNVSRPNTVIPFIAIVRSVASDFITPLSADLVLEVRWLCSYENLGSKKSLRTSQKT